jgi:Sulfocyanin (SoxE) domain
MLAMVANSPSAARGAATLPALTYTAATHTVSFALTAGEGAGYNFNGYANGALVVKVPTGSTVEVTMRNTAADLSHSVLVSPWTDRTKGSGLTAAFPGAAPADFETGVTSHDQPIHFRFTAAKAGTFALACGVPGHALIGMWDEFDVVDGLAVPSAAAK